MLSVVNAPVFGGGHNQAVRLNAALEARGWRTLAVVPDEPGNARERLEEGEVEVLSMPLHRLRATVDPRVQARFATGLRREVSGLRQLIRQRRIDLVQAHGVTQVHAPLAARLEGVAVVWELYDTRAPMGLRRLLMPLVTHTADVITPWGLELARVHPGALGFGDRLVPVFPPVDAAEFRPDDQRRREGRASLGVPEGAPLIGTVGNLNPQKGHEHLIRAAALVRESHPDLRVRIAGAPGEVHAAYYRRLRTEAEELGLAADERLQFIGPAADVASLLPSLDVLVISSVPRSEGIPTVIVEAMACGVPVVATDVGAVMEAVEEGVTGYVVAPADPRALAGAISRVLGDPALRIRMGEAGRRTAVDRFDIERCADLRARAYDIAVAHRRSG